MAENNELQQLNSTQVEHEYGGSEIQVLEGLEAVRKRPGVTSALPVSRDFITWCTKLWITPSTRPWRATAPISP